MSEPSEGYHPPTRKGSDQAGGAEWLVLLAGAFTTSRLFTTRLPRVMKSR